MYVYDKRLYKLKRKFPILPILPSSLPFLLTRPHHGGWAGDAASPPLLVVLILIPVPTSVVDGAATIGLGLGSGFADADEGQEQGTVDDTGGIVGEMGEAIVALIICVTAVTQLCVSCSIVVWQLPHCWLTHRACSLTLLVDYFKPYF